MKNLMSRISLGVRGGVPAAEQREWEAPFSLLDDMARMAAEARGQGNTFIQNGFWIFLKAHRHESRPWEPLKMNGSVLSVSMFLTWCVAWWKHRVWRVEKSNQNWMRFASNLFQLEGHQHQVQEVSWNIRALERTGKQKTWRNGNERKVKKIKRRRPRASDKKASHGLAPVHAPTTPAQTQTCRQYPQASRPTCNTPIRYCIQALFRPQQQQDCDHIKTIFYLMQPWFAPPRSPLSQNLQTQNSTIML